MLIINNSKLFVLTARHVATVLSKSHVHAIYEAIVTNNRLPLRHALSYNVAQ